MNILTKKEDKKLLWIVIIIFIFAFFIFRPYFMQERGLLYGGDDEGYFAHATSLVFFQFPDYSKEFYTDAGTGAPPTADNYPMHSIGPALMSFPFVFTFSLIDRIQGSSIVEKRDVSNIIDSWTLFGFVLSTIFYFYVGILLLYKALRNYFDDIICLYSILFMILFQYFFLYVFRRPVLSHIYEFFLQSILVYFFIKDSKTKFINNTKLWFAILIGVLIGLIILVRNNNILFAVLWPVVLFCFENNRFSIKKGWKKLLISYSIGIIIVFIFKFVLLLIYKYEAYGYVVKNIMGRSNLFDKANLFFLFKSFLNVIFGIDFGIIFTAPFILLGIFCLFFLKFDIKKKLLIIFFPIMLNIFFALGLKGWYGYRYFVFSITPLLLFPLAQFFNSLKEKKILKKWLIVFFILSILPIASMVVFEGNSTNLTLHLKEQYFGLTDWGNKFYQVEIWKTLFLNPSEIFKAVFKGGPLYLVYLIAQIFHLNKFLPAIVLEKYSVFNIKILIKTIIIYIFPFILYLIYPLSIRIKSKKLSKIT